MLGPNQSNYVNALLPRAVAASMAHSVQTARRVYDVHGMTAASQRLAGIASLERQRLAAADAAGDGEAGAEDASGR